MLFTGLTIENNGSDNVIEIENETIFKTSRIIINGNNNRVTIGKALLYRDLIINFRGGNNKVFEIKPSSKNILGVNFNPWR